MATLVGEFPGPTLVLRRGLLRWRVSFAILRLRLSRLIIRCFRLSISSWVSGTALLSILWRRNDRRPILGSGCGPWILPSGGLLCRIRGISWLSWTLLGTRSRTLISLSSLIACRIRCSLSSRLLVRILVCSRSLWWCICWSLSLLGGNLSGGSRCWRCIVLAYLLTLTPYLWFTFLTTLLVHLLKFFEFLSLVIFSIWETLLDLCKLVLVSSSSTVGTLAVTHRLCIVVAKTITHIRILLRTQTSSHRCHQFWVHLDSCQHFRVIPVNVCL